jgi:hypothetical protein
MRDGHEMNDLKTFLEAINHDVQMSLQYLNEARHEAAHLESADSGADVLSDITGKSRKRSPL